MAVSLNLNEILSQVKRLNKEDQINLLQKLVLLVKKTESTKSAAVRLTSLSGLGSDIWERH